MSRLLGQGWAGSVSDPIDHSKLVKVGARKRGRTKRKDSLFIIYLTLPTCFKHHQVSVSSACFYFPRQATVSSFRRHNIIYSGCNALVMSFFFVKAWVSQPSAGGPLNHNPRIDWAKPVSSPTGRLTGWSRRWWMTKTRRWSARLYNDHFLFFSLKYSDPKCHVHVSLVDIASWYRTEPFKE